MIAKPWNSFRTLTNCVVADHSIALKSHGGALTILRRMRLCFAAVLGAALYGGACTAAEPDYAATVVQDAPVVWFRFEGGNATEIQSEKVPADASLTFEGRTVGHVGASEPGPRSDRFPLFDETNLAVKFSGDGGTIRIADPGDDSPFDFTIGDSITLEAWVAPAKLGSGQQMYVVGKGRTKNAGFASENQNYALRLSGEKGGACVSFLFRNAQNRPGKQEDFHRWTTTKGFAPDGSWHHIAATYTFGKSDSIKGYIDGKSIAGKWDYGGATNDGPVVDNDEIWIGSALGGNAGNSFNGLIDEVAIYRSALPAERIASRFRVILPPTYVTTWPATESGVLCEVMEGIPDEFSWDFPAPKPTDSWREAAFGLTEIPQKYNAHGVRIDRSNPVMVRMTGWYTFPAEPRRLLLRSRSGSRLFIDGELVVDNPFPKARGDGHGALYDISSKHSSLIRPPQTGDHDSVALFQGTGKPQLVTLEVLAGGRKHRPEWGETGVFMELQNDRFWLLNLNPDPVELTDTGWIGFTLDQHERLERLNQTNRKRASVEYARYWDRRHQTARELVDAWKPLATIEDAKDLPRLNEIDRYINVKLAAAEVSPAPLIDDWAFRRRVSLDVIGTLPPANLSADASPEGTPLDRAAWIDQLLEHPGWADNWMGYWQDVLAENPNIVNPTLNNTGPFRWWLHESFTDNKPFDRFATELILMEGSTHFGGPAGFGLASQNDSPMAAKAHVLAQAFLGMEMKCARCHDAPYHDFTQRDLFSLAAMLKREPEKVPKTSTIPGDPAVVASLLVKVTLKPGEAIPPEWPFARELNGELATDILINRQDQREQLAALVTAPVNRRFAQVLVNRMWQRYLGRGLVEPVDDWEHAAPSHPELLEYLEREFIRSGYDLKHIARLILNSHVYQRRADSTASIDAKRAALFAGPLLRRMSAEQVVDSLFGAVGKPFNVEEMSIDTDSQRTYEQSLSMGVPRRAWQFASLSNERDRPSLSLPAAQSIINVLETFGWRSSRPDPLSIRPQETSVLQPAILANGLVARRVSQLSDDSRITELALKDLTLPEFVDEVFKAILSRPATSQEREMFRELLEEGYDTRKIDGPIVIPVPPRATGVTWSNHLKPEASDRKLALAAELERGDPPTQRLRPEWRERAEDFLWTLLNSPEFVFIP
jgi:hypothetical protein